MSSRARVSGFNGSFSCCSQRGIAKSILTRRSKAREVAPRPITGLELAARSYRKCAGIESYLPDI